jgi:hypothetical protein
MLIAKGKVGSAEPWNILEVSMNQSPDIVAQRMQKEFTHLHEPAVEALIPYKRTVNGDPEWIVEQVYVRGANGSLSKLARVPGIDFIRKERADESWITRLLELEREPDPQELTAGTFVRVLVGPCSRMCGHVAQIRANSVTVSIKMRTKRIRVYASPDQLQIVDCPPDQQTFYFQK